MYNPAPSLISLLTSAGGDPVPLMGVSISGDVFGAQSRMVVRQRYRNKESRPIEAIYTFPLPSEAVLIGFAMECAGRRLEGEVKEREEAFQAYDEAIIKGHGAALLDQERRNVFTASVGNLLPGEETVIEVTYVQRLSADEGALRLMIPTLVAPRYTPGAPQGDRTGHGAQEPTDRVPDADRVSPRIGAVSYGLSIDILFDVGRDVVIESPSHDIEVRSEGQRVRRVRFRRDTVPLDRDLILLASSASRGDGQGLAAGVVAERRRGQDGTFMLTVVPDLFDPSGRAQARDVVFVVDVSGSMAGSSIEQARSAMRLCLRHLSEGDRFQIIAFSTSMKSFDQGLVPFTQRTLSAADSWVASLDAAGGTEMLEPLLAAVSALGSDSAKRSRVVVLLTDGQVSNEAEIIRRVGEKAAGVRIYTFGIGTNVSDLLLRELAQRTRGDVEFIYPGERIDEKVTTQFARATAARVEEVSLRFSGVDAGEIAPSETPSLVDGEPWVIFGRYSEPGFGRAEIRGSLRGERFFLEVPIELPASGEREGLASLWAAARIRELEDAEGSLTGRRGEANKKRIAQLSVEHGIASKYASFVVVERRTGDRRAHGQPETRTVPVSGPAGWSMGFGPEMNDGGGQHMTRAGSVSPRASAMIAALSQGYGTAGAMPAGGAFGGARPRMPSPAYAGPPRAAVPAGPPAAPPAYIPVGGSGSTSGGPPPDLYSAPAAPAHADADNWSANAREAPRSPIQAMGQAVMGAVGKLFGGKGGEARSNAPEPARAPAMKAPAPMPAGAPPAAAPMASSPSGDPRALLEKQLASGLWEGAGGDDASRLLATALALAACYSSNIDSSHSIYGAQIRKAVEAICKVAIDVIKQGGHLREAQAALVAAYLVASGKRLRSQVVAAIDGSGSDPIRALSAQLTSPEAASRKLSELGVSI